MAEPTTPPIIETPQERHEHAHAGILRAYLLVFGALCVFTAASFVINAFVPEKETSTALILGIAVVKAGLVAFIFMHLKYDWPKVYGFLVPILILCIMSALVFLPDFGMFYWYPAPWNE